MAVTYDVLQRVLSENEKIHDTVHFREWCAANEVALEDLGRAGAELAEITLEDMRDGERTLLEGLIGMFLSGYIGGFKTAKLDN